MPYKRVSKKTGRQVWYASAYEGRKRIFVKVGPRKRDAEAVEADLKAKIARGEYLGIYEEKKVTLGEFVPKYLEYSKTYKSEESCERDRMSLQALRSSDFGGKYLGQICEEDIDRYMALRATQVKAGRVNKEVATLRHLYTLAIQWKYVSRNPVKGVKLLKEPPGRIRYLLQEQRWRLHEACEALSPILKAIVVMAENTGMRAGEIRGLTWDAIDLQARTITLLKTKNNELRMIPINDTLYAELEALPGPRDPGLLVFPGWRRDTLTHSFAKVASRAGIADFRFHDLRHDFASQLVMKEVGLRAVQCLLGHKDLRMTVRYSHLSQDHLQGAVNLLDRKSVPQEEAGGVQGMATSWLPDTVQG